MTQKIQKYGFGGRLKQEFPSQVIIDTTELCNLACIHCPHPTFKKSEHYSGISLPKDLNKKAIDEIAVNGKNRVQYVRYTGEGETLIHKDFFEMLSYATKNSGVPVTVTTNGMLLNSERVEKILNCQPNIIDISIDALVPETYEKIRINGKLNITQSNVLQLIKSKLNRFNCTTKVVVSFIEQPLNTHETHDFVKFWEDIGADYVAVRRLHSAAGSVVGVAQKMHEENAKEKRRPCVYPWERIVLNPRGFLAFCPADWTHGSSIADYRTTTIMETWNSSFYQNLRQAHLSNNYSCHAFCGQCPDWKATVWPGTGRSYADMVVDFKNSE